ncbi:MAG: response regulator [Nitrospira sp.]|nr:response regulator [Nitrospira sp.]
MTLPERKGAILLIVEDDRDMRSLLCDEFWGTGYHLREARDGDEAFLSVLQSAPDLILTDLRMPAGGDDYVSRLRTVAPHCPIVVITGFGDASLKARVLKAGRTPTLINRSVLPTSRNVCNNCWNLEPRLTADESIPSSAHGVSCPEQMLPRDTR